MTFVSMQVILLKAGDINEDNSLSVAAERSNRANDGVLTSIINCGRMRMMQLLEFRPLE